MDAKEKERFDRFCKELQGLIERYKIDRWEGMGVAITMAAKAINDLSDLRFFLDTLTRSLPDSVVEEAAAACKFSEFPTPRLFPGEN